jgi:hypothetical protein
LVGIIIIIIVIVIVIVIIMTRTRNGPYDNQQRKIFYFIMGVIGIRSISLLVLLSPRAVNGELPSPSTSSSIHTEDLQQQQQQQYDQVDEQHEQQQANDHEDETSNSQKFFLGIMIDGGRHHFPVDWLKVWMDDVSKMNVNAIHMTITNDQRFNLPLDNVKKYPNDDDDNNNKNARKESMRKNSSHKEVQEQFLDELLPLGRLPFSIPHNTE